MLQISSLATFTFWIFSPDELLAQNRKPFNLPLHGGPKAFAPGFDNDEENKALESMLQEQRDVLKEQRIHKKYCFLYTLWLN